VFVHGTVAIPPAWRRSLRLGSFAPHQQVLAFGQLLDVVDLAGLGLREDDASFAVRLRGHGRTIPPLSAFVNLGGRGYCGLSNLLSKSPAPHLQLFRLNMG